MKEHVMTTSYETDVVAWANEQAALLRSGNLSAIDALNIAEEIESVGRSERNELESRMAVLLAHLLKWQFQPERRGHSWEATIKIQRLHLAKLLRNSLSLKHNFEDEKFLRTLWLHAAVLAGDQTLLDMPRTWIWPLDLVLDDNFWPD
jgi:Domain of unknown function DUF29